MNATLPYIKELTIAMRVSDMNASIKWYTEVMGFELLYQLDDMGWAEMKSSVPGVNIGVSQVEDIKLGGPTPTFGVSDIESARATLESQDVRFDGETMTIPGMVKLATFFDPDGNSLMLFESLNESE
ncbi:MAG: VOC family protein [Phycisphaerales bacterium]|jgi:catechol 2,3-dioxygenase-like lactoylglutathione lyase family enzyme|nr:VOC family protein [Phycisphaerales bacterium]